MRILFTLLISLQSFFLFAQYGQNVFGVNLAGAEFGEDQLPGSFGSNYTYPTASELDYYKSKGQMLIRMPFRWERIQPTKNGTLDTDELERMKTFVQAAEDRCMYILLDMHNYARYYGARIEGAEGNVKIADFADVWKKLALEFKNYTNIWGYGLVNEPHSMPTGSTWFSAAQAAITAIRDVDTTTPIVVAGDDWSSAARWQSKSDNLKHLSDPSDLLIYEAHLYFDADHSGTYKGTYDSEGAYPNVGVDRAAPFINWLRNNGKRGFFGEYGVPSNDIRWLTCLDNFLEEIEKRGINGTYWAGGPWWGSYPLSVEPSGNTDKPQMGILEDYGTFTTDCLLTLSSKGFDAQEEWQVYPNPTHEKINISTDRQLEWELYNVTGIKVSQGLGNEVNMQSLPAGLYMLKIGDQIKRIEKY